MPNLTLTYHTYVKGVFVTKLNEMFKDGMTEQNWYYQRMPEYIWIGLILNKYFRKEGLKIIYSIISDLHKSIPEIETLRLSDIIALPPDLEKKAYEIFLKYIEDDVLSPLTPILDYSVNKQFSSYFLETHVNLEKRLEILHQTINDMSEGGSNFSTDVRFVVLYFMGMTGKLKFIDGVGTDFISYPELEHEDEKMHMIRPFIRSAELIVLSALDKSNSITYLNLFWERMFNMSECTPKAFVYEESKSSVEDLKIYFKSTLISLQELMIHSDPVSIKKTVLIGLGVFSYKRFTELIDHNLECSISGRSIIRTLIECYFMIKYLLSVECENPNIWYEFQLHGISKYKTIIEKYSVSATKFDDSHVPYEYIDILVREFKDKEFIDLDLRYFKDLTPRKLSEIVEETDLYHFFYDYDSSFEHGLWGAVRESSFVKCFSPEHLYHYVPDFNGDQNMKSVLKDSISIMNKIIDNILQGFSEKE